MSTKSRKVLFIATTTTAGGIDSASIRAASELMKRGSDVLYVTASSGAIYQHCLDNGIPNDKLTTKNSGDLSSIFQVARFVRQFQPDIVHVHSRRDYVTAALGTRLAAMQTRQNPKVVLHLHLHKVMGAPPRLAGWFFQHVSDKAIAVSKAVQQFVTDTHHLRPDYVETIYNGIEASDYLFPGSADYATARIDQRTAYGIAQDDQVIGMLGRFSAKGQNKVIGLIPELLRELPRLKLVLIGADSAADKDSTEPNYREAAQSAEVSDRVIVMGLTDAVPSLLPILDVLVHLPDNEAFGLALVEAMAAGLPVIASDIPGCREVIDMTEGGIAIDPADLNALRSNLKRLFDPVDGPSLRRSYGDKGRKAVVDQLDMPEQVKLLEDLYDRITGRLPVVEPMQAAN